MIVVGWREFIQRLRFPYAFLLLDDWAQRDSRLN